MGFSFTSKEDVTRQAMEIINSNQGGDHAKYLQSGQTPMRRKEALKVTSDIQGRSNVGSPKSSMFWKDKS